MLRSNSRTPLRLRPQAGFSLIELLIASAVMLVGLSGGLILISVAIANNGRSKNDSSGTLLAQMTAELIASVPASATSPLSVQDCNPDSSAAGHSINIAGSTAGAGAPLNGSGVIDFAQSPVSGYSMTFYGCQASTRNREALYDVRWNIRSINANTKIVTVAAGLKGGSRAGANFYFAPVSLRTIVGPQ